MYAVKRPLATVLMVVSRASRWITSSRRIAASGGQRRWITSPPPGGPFLTGADRLCGLTLEGDHHRALADAKNIARMLPWIVGRERLSGN